MAPFISMLITEINHKIFSSFLMIINYYEQSDSPPTHFQQPDFYLRVFLEAIESSLQCTQRKTKNKKYLVLHPHNRTPSTQVPRFSSLIVHMFCSNVEIFGCLFWTALECFVARNCKCNSQMFPLFPWFGFMEVKSSERRRCIIQLGVQQFSF